MTTSESFRQSVAERLHKLVESPDPHKSVSFPSCLSAEERKYVHHIAEQLGLRHDSKGKGDGRYITVTRDPSKEAKRGIADHRDADCLRLPAAAWEVLDHPLLLHAAKDDNTEAVKNGASLRAVEAEEIAQLLTGSDKKERNPAPRTGAAHEKTSGPPNTPLLQARQQLPAWPLREALVEAVTRHQVTMVVGETGCGKSTQVPQFLLEEGGSETNIIVTQPRRLSALALAHRVAHERGESAGQTVGYSVHLDHTASSSTQLLFCTTGVLRRKLLADPTLSGVTHLVLDELHEREKVADFLLVAVRELLPTRPEFRVILMSATMQQDTFRRYFEGCAEVSIPGRTFPVKEYFLNDIAPTLHSLGYHLALGPGFAAGGFEYGSWENSGNEKSFKYQVLVSNCRHGDGLCGFGSNASKPLRGKRLDEGLFLHDVLQQMKGVTYDIPMVEALLATIALGQAIPEGAATETSSSGGILVFLPGWDDIDRLKRRLRKHAVLGDQQHFLILALHSHIQLDQQREVFRKPPAGVRKIILSTNIAETSITVDDVRTVIDCGRAKESSYDAFLRVPTLNTSWISRAAVAQRAGRAGRTAPGVCYHMFAQQRADMFDSHRKPEMLRTPLDDVCLHARLLLTLQNKLDMPALQYLSQAPDPPDEQSVRNSELLLSEIGAVTSNQDQLPRLTALGVHLSALPLTPQFAKVILWANLLGVGSSALAVISGLQYREPFVSIGDASKPMSLAEANRVVRAAKRSLCGQHDLSDHLALLRASEGFEAARAKGGDHARSFCEAHSLSCRQMQTMRQTSARLKSELQGRGLWGEGADRNGSDAALLRAALCAGLFPNVASRSAKGGSKLKVQGGRLEALPHVSSVCSFSRGGKDIWDQWGDATAQHVDNEGRGSGDAASERWLCFNELSQVEDNYSLSGLSPASTSSLLLLCGEGDLTIFDTEVPEAGTSPTAPDEAFSSFWASADPDEAAPQTTEGAQTPDRRSKGDVVVSVSELGDRFAVKMHKGVAARVQALRAMLRFVFRVFCRDPSRWPDLLAEGQPGCIVIELATQIFREEVGASEDVAQESAKEEMFRNKRSQQPSQQKQQGGLKHKDISPEAKGDPHGKPHVDTRADLQPATAQKGKEEDSSRGSKATKAKKQQPKETFYPSVAKPKRDQAEPKHQQKKIPTTTVVCGLCGMECSESDGCAHGSEAWYCFACWEIYYASLQQQQQQQQLLRQNASWWQFRR